MLIAAPVGSHQERIYQVFGRETLDQLLPLAAMLPLARVGLPQPPPWAKRDEDEPQDKLRARRVAPARVRLEAGNSEAEPEFDVRFRQWAADPRQAGAARAHRRLPQHPAADGVPGGAAVPGTAEHRGGCERAPIESGGALPAAVGGARLRARLGARGADEGAPGAAVHPGDHGPADGVARTVARSSVARVRRRGPHRPPCAGEFGITQDDADFALHAPSLPPVSQRLEFQGSIAVDANAAMPGGAFCVAGSFGTRRRMHARACRPAAQRCAAAGNA